MTPNQLADLDEVVGRMTPGPFVAFQSKLSGEKDGTRFGWVIEQTGGINRIGSYIFDFAVSYAHGDFDGIIKQSDAEGFVALRNSYSLLRDHIKALELEIERLRR